MIGKLIKQLSGLWKQRKHNKSSDFEHALDCAALMSNLQLIRSGEKIKSNNNLDFLILMLAPNVPSKLGERLGGGLGREVRIVSGIRTRASLLGQKTNRL